MGAFKALGMERLAGSQQALNKGLMCLSQPRWLFLSHTIPVAQSEDCVSFDDSLSVKGSFPGSWQGQDD